MADKDLPERALELHGFDEVAGRVLGWPKCWACGTRVNHYDPAWELCRETETFRSFHYGNLPSPRRRIEMK